MATPPNEPPGPGSWAYWRDRHNRYFAWPGFGWAALVMIVALALIAWLVS